MSSPSDRSGRCGRSFVGHFVFLFSCMITLSFDTICTWSLSLSLKYRSHAFGNVTARLFPTLMIFLVST